MKINVLAVVVILGSVALSGGAAADGKKAFLDANCALCHSISSQDITSNANRADLSKLGSSRDAEWIAKFLRREVKVKNAAHPLPWNGTDKQLSLISDWLASLK